MCQAESNSGRQITSSPRCRSQDRPVYHRERRGGGAGRKVSSGSRDAVLVGAFKTGKCPDSRLSRALLTSG